MPPLRVCQYPGPVKNENEEVVSLHEFQTCYLSGIRVTEAHHFNGCPPIIAWFSQICSSKAPDFQALQVTTGCQADEQDMTVIWADGYIHISIIKTIKNTLGEG